MLILKKLYCRAFQAAFRLAIPFLPYREPRLIGSVGEAARMLSEAGKRSVLVVTSPGSARHGLLSPLLSALSECAVAYTVYDRTQPNPTVLNVEEALGAYREGGCSAIVALGGGSVIDCAKGVGARLAYPKRPLSRLAGVMRVRRRIPTLVAIPTTAGTGSETTLAAVITDGEARHKYAIMSFPLIPHFAVLDPIFTYTLPRHLTATTGMDALTHAVEAYIGRATTAKTRRLAEGAVKLIFENVEAACDAPEGREARKAMLEASYMAGVAFSVSYVGYVHALAHSLGGHYDTPHGLANAVLLPHVLRGYGRSAEKKLHRLAVAIGAVGAGEDCAAGALAFIEAVEALCRRLEIPPVIPELRREDIPALAATAEREANPLYPVPRLMTKEELCAFYEAIAP